MLNKVRVNKTKASPEMAGQLGAKIGAEPQQNYVQTIIVAKVKPR